MAYRIRLLGDGRLVGIRAVTPDDHAALAALYRSVSVETRRARFHGAAVPSAGYLRTLAGLPRSGEGAALVAVALPGESVVAVAECRIDPALPGPTADVGILVHDDYQGVRLGSQLWNTLVGEARQLGIERLQVDLETGNRRMLRLVARARGSRTLHTRGAHTRVLVDIGSGAPAANGPAHDDEQHGQCRMVPGTESRSAGVESR